MQPNEEALFKFRISSKAPQPPKISENSKKARAVRIKLEMMQEQKAVDSVTDYLDYDND